MKAIAILLLFNLWLFAPPDHSWVKIGNQTWTNRNLDVSTFRNGDPIRECRSHEDWMEASHKEEPAWCYYNNDPGLGKTYGKLYNFWAVTDARGLAPEGWHIPSDEEWQVLIAYAGGKEEAGGHLKEEGTAHWKEQNVKATNNTGFNALPGGFREGYVAGAGGFKSLGNSAVFWSAVSEKNRDSQVKHLVHFNGRVRQYGLKSLVGLSVRCVKD